MEEVFTRLVYDAIVIVVVCYSLGGMIVEKATFTHSYFALSSYKYAEKRFST